MTDVQIPDWLKGLPLAPVFRPTDTEFADPIAYISKIEKEASAFGICKIIPPLPKPSKKYVIANLNKSLAKCPELGPDINLVGSGSSSKKSCVKEVNGGEFRAVFTTRQQELGLSTKNKKGVQPQPPAARKQVWQSGEVYTLEQFELKSKAFAKSQLGMVKELSPLVIETLFWKAASEKPIYIEYANDVPGSGFGEPEGSFLHFRRRRRRKWTYNRNSGGSCDRNKYQSDSTSNNNNNALASTKESLESPCVKSKAPSCLPTKTSNQTSQHSRKDGSDVVNEVEGTAGWKLSNSPWNLQVISRSPGSLTRFMPDDIPGVTSPMVYIGMLFSWFAWHVEDHELHSMNFLHTGSPKTWYAVPVDYAFTFEEVIRNQAYGGAVDRLAALTHLGEKTTLLSPEVVVESGIPCCRLVQYPGEFVVTFPRAYHVGFSHGFNCGEAANFGTSKWLQVAKEAAVRRAAMNCLPMLSHQQLLYLLTMSFVSRVPISLLPGARSSRLRDRLKEERELSVKKSFIEDILRENKLLTTLLGRDSSYHVVLWDLDSLPSLSKGSEHSSSVTPLETATAEAISSKNKNDKDLVSEMNSFMENVNDLYSNDDFSCDLQVDSGTLACMACGILGFPFMSVVQPSKQASLALLQDMGESKHTHPGSPPALDDNMVGAFVSDERKKKTEQTERKSFHHANGVASRAESSTSMVSSSKDLSTAKPPQNLPTSVETKLDEDSGSTRGFLRPRIFCLEHAIQIEEMLRSRGGANILVLCHSDFQKIKAHAAAIAEEIGSSFKYTEIPLDRASEAELNLLDLAIDDEHGDHVEDWTSKLKVNLRHYVNIRKTCPSKQVQHALALDGLFSSATPISRTVNLNWSSKRSRTKVLYNLLANQRKSSKNVQQQTPDLMELSTSNQIGEKEVMNMKSDATVARKEGKLIQYSRRNFKPKRCCLASAGLASGHSEDTSATILAGGGLNEHGKNCDTGKSEKHLDKGFVVATGDQCKNSSPSENAGSSTVATPRVEDAETQLKDGFLDVAVSEDKTSAPENGSEDHDTKVDGSYNERDEPMVEDADVEQSSNQSNSEVSVEEDSSLVSAGTSCTDDRMECSSESQGEKSQVEEGRADTEEVDSVGEEESLNISGDEEKETATSNPGHGEESTSVSTEESHEDSSHADGTEEAHSSGAPNKGEISDVRSSPKNRRKRRREVDMLTDVQFDLKSFIRSPCEGLRSRPSKQPKRGAESTRVTDDKPTTRGPAKQPKSGVGSTGATDDKPTTRGPAKQPKSVVESTGATVDKPSPRKLRKRPDGVVSSGGKVKKDEGKGSFRCDLQGCRMSFHKKEHLRLHKSNRCPHEGCRKKFSCHKYLLRHQKVHNDDRPLKCSWKGCSMTFKWAWARTEHLRVHTGERPYQCKVEGCGLRFRFVSDYSRHRRKTGHYVNPSS